MTDEKKDRSMWLLVPLIIGVLVLFNLLNYASGSGNPDTCTGTHGFQESC